MREILFRGKRLTDGERVFGDFRNFVDNDDKRGSDGE